MSGSLCLYVFLMLFPWHFLICLFVLSYSNLLTFALSCFYLIIISWMNFCFLTSDRKGVTPDGREGGKDMGDSSQNICMKKIFSVKKQRNIN